MLVSERTHLADQSVGRLVTLDLVYELVEGGKKMKVAPYGERWAGFGLDGSTPNVPKGMKGYTQRPGFRPGFRQKPVRR